MSLAQLSSGLSMNTRGRVENFTPQDAQHLELEPGAARAIRAIVGSYYADYITVRNKRRWCDKSLDNFIFAPLLKRVFPGARFICLYRHCMDVVASGLEVSPWGLQGYGFENFVPQFPGNSVAAISAYWLNCTQSIIGFEETNPNCCLRVRYEDMATDPERTAEYIFKFLGIEHVPGISSSCFILEHDYHGPGDQKIWFTNRIVPDSLGRGVRIPPQTLPPRLLSDINYALGELGYRRVDERWNASVWRVDPREENADVAQRVAAEVSPNAKDARNLIVDRLAYAKKGKQDNFIARWPGLAGRVIQIVINGDGYLPARLECWLDQSGSCHVKLVEAPGGDPSREMGQADSAGCTTIVARAETWRSLLSGEANLAVELQASRVRCIGPIGMNGSFPLEVMVVADLLGLSAPALTLAGGAEDWRR